MSWKLNKISVHIIFGITIGSLITALFQSAGETLWAKLWEGEPTIIVCAPLKSARAIIRAGDEILLDVATEYPNYTTVEFKNNTRSSLKNFKMLIYPFSNSSTKPVALMARISTTNLVFAPKFDVQQQDSQFLIQAPQFSEGESLFSEIFFYEPISYIIEVTTDNQSWKQVSTPGCTNNNSIKLLAPVEIYRFIDSKYCSDDGNCSYSTGENKAYEFEIREEHKGLPITQEMLIIQD